jgi:hypothetical protein
LFEHRGVVLPAGIVAANAAGLIGATAVAAYRSHPVYL